MFECKGCGGNMVFDIASQQMKCPYCEAMADPYSMEEAKEAKESGMMDVTVHICPQCGGAIYSADNSAAEFCSFCGASTILNTRIQQEKRPTKIVPFAKTKEDCQKSYHSLLSRCLYAPSALRNVEKMNEFRGIYMPYWSYDVKQHGPIDVAGTKSYRRGDYVYEETYSIKGQLDAEYLGIPYDAASNFSDDISERCAPYDTKNMNDFTPAFISGFYADIADVDKSVYKSSASQFANTESLARIKNNQHCKKYTIKDDQASNSTLGTKVTDANPIMLPVWFMSYRYKDRIAYATVNGQTGKVAADIPVDMKKFAIGTVLLFGCLWCFLNLVLSLNGNSSVIVGAVISFITFFIYASETDKIAEWESGSADKGKNSTLTPEQKAAARKKRKESRASVPKSKGFWLPLLAGVFAIIIWILAPHDDIWYFGASILVCIATLVSVVMLVSRYNLLTTRKLPQLNARGGESDAQ